MTCPPTPPAADDRPPARQTSPAAAEETFTVTVTLRAQPDPLNPLLAQVRAAGKWLQQSWWGGDAPADLLRWDVAQVAPPEPATGAAVVGGGGARARRR